MAHITDDRVLESTTTTGTGALTLAGALTGFKTFGSAKRSDGTSAQSGDTCLYSVWAVDSNGNLTGDFEAGLGTLGSGLTTLTRTTVIRSSNSDAAVSFASGTKYVAIAALASRTLQLDNELKAPIPLVAAATAVTAPSAVGTLFSRTWAGRAVLAGLGPDGIEQLMQGHLARAKPAMWMPPGNATTVPGVFGMAAWTTTGTATSRTVATTNRATRMRRLGYVSAGTAGALSYQYAAAAQLTCGSGTAGDGSGFLFVMQFVPSNAATVSGERFFVGMTSSTSAPTNVDPATLTNAIGIAQLSSDATQMYLVYGGSAAQTAVALGATNFPGATLSTTAFELAIFAPSGVANTYCVQVTNLNNGAVYTTTLTGGASVVPQSSTLLAPRIWKTNNSTAAAVAFDNAGAYIGPEC